MNYCYRIVVFFIITAIAVLVSAIPGRCQISADTLGAESIQVGSDSAIGFDESSVITDTISGNDALASNDTITVDEKSHSPKRAMFLSMALPGLGQAYNEKYWKIPLIYGLGGTLVYFIIENGKQYRKYGDSYLASIDSTGGYTNHFPNLTPQQLRVGRDYFRRWRDLDIILLIMLYGANIVDALVDGHMKTFDVSNKLSMQVKPDLYIDRFSNTTAGLSFTFKFK